MTEIPNSRTALAEAISEEFDFDLTENTLAVIDRVLIRLFLFGYVVARDSEQEP